MGFDTSGEIAVENEYDEDSTRNNFANLGYLIKYILIK